jgi:hypothetical protein
MNRVASSKLNHLTAVMTCSSGALDDVEHRPSPHGNAVPVAIHSDAWQPGDAARRGSNPSIGETTGSTLTTLMSNRNVVPKSILSYPSTERTSTFAGIEYPVVPYGVSTTSNTHMNNNNSNNNNYHESLAQSRWDHDSLGQQSQRTYQRPPDFVTHSTNGSSFLLDASHRNRHSHGDTGNTMTHHGLSKVSTPTPSMSSTMTSGAPLDWSGLDMLAAVTFDAAASLDSSAPSYLYGMTPTSTISAAPSNWSSSSNDLHAWPQQQQQQQQQEHTQGRHAFMEGQQQQQQHVSSYNSVKGPNHTNFFPRQLPSDNGSSNNSNRYG